MSRGASTKPFTFSAPLTLSSADLEKKEEAIVSPIEEKGWTGHCKFILSFCAVPKELIHVAPKVSFIRHYLKVPVRTQSTTL